MKGHTEFKSRQVTGSNQNGEGEVPPAENTPSTEAAFSGEISRGLKFDDPLHNITKETRMPEAHSSSDN